MPTVTHRIVSPTGTALAVRSVEVRLRRSTPRPLILRASDGGEVEGARTVPMNPVDGAYPTAASVSLEPNSAFHPEDTWYELKCQLVGGESNSDDRAPLRIVVPDQAGPLRAVDLLVNPPGTAEPLVVGWTPRGVWNDDAQYYARDVVEHQGASYVARHTNASVTPGTDPDTWQAVGGRGEKGDEGDPGPTGPPGPANTLTVDTVTTSAPGTPAEATVGGAAPNQTLSLVLPRGTQGPPGAGSPDATTTDKGSIRLHGGTAEDWTVPWGKVTGAPDIAELARDTLGAALVAGPNVTITPNDAGDTITVAATVPAGYTDEQARDALGAALVAGAGLGITVNDPGDTITIASARALFQGRATANQTLANVGQWYPVALGAEDYDDLGGHSTTTNTSRFVAPKAGLYRFDGAALFNSGQATTAGSTLRASAVAKNGTVVAGSVCQTTYTGTLLSAQVVSMLVTLAANDYLELWAFTGLANTTLYGAADGGSVLSVEFIR